MCPRKRLERSAIVSCAAWFSADMPTPPRSRVHLLAWTIVLVVLGLGSRRGGMPDFVVLYAGDALWGAFFFVLGALLWPGASPLRLWLGSVALTELIEGSQAWRAPELVALRTTPLGGLLLGHAFLWSDVACVAIGATIAFLVDSRSRLASGRLITRQRSSGGEAYRRTPPGGA